MIETVNQLGTVRAGTAVAPRSLTRLQERPDGAFWFSSSAAGLAWSSKGERSRANVDGTLKVGAGGRLELIKTRDTAGYVAISGDGIAAVSINKFYNAIDANQNVRDAVGFFTGEVAAISICGVGQ